MKPAGARRHRGLDMGKSAEGRAAALGPEVGGVGGCVLAASVLLRRCPVHVLNDCRCEQLGTTSDGVATSIHDAVIVLIH